MPVELELMLRREKSFLFTRQAVHATPTLLNTVRLKTVLLNMVMNTCRAAEPSGAEEYHEAALPENLFEARLRCCHGETEGAPDGGGGTSYLLKSGG